MNTATRLHDLLVEIRDIQPPDHVDNLSRYQLRFALLNVLDIPTKDHNKIYSLYGGILAMTEDIIRQLRSNPITNSDLYVDPITAIKEAFTKASLDGSVRDFNLSIEPKDLRSLEFAAHALEQSHGEAEISEEDLNNWNDIIESLLIEVNDMQPLGEFSVCLAFHLGRLTSAISQYRYFGTSNLQTEVSHIFGELYLDPRQSASSEDEKSRLMKTLDLIKAINSVATFLRNGKELLSSADLPSLPNS